MQREEREKVRRRYCRGKEGNKSGGDTAEGRKEYKLRRV
jgi:hypothetical protein